MAAGKTLQQRFSTVPVASSTVALDNLQIASTNSLDVYVFFCLFVLKFHHTLVTKYNSAKRECMDVPFSVCVGILFFGEVITLKFVIGTAVIIASTYYIFLREQAQN